MKPIKPMVFFWVFALFLALTTPSAHADLANGTPLFSCTLPSSNTDSTAIPATGNQSLAAVKFYVDNVLKKHVIRPGLTAPTGTGSYTGTPTGALACTWQAVGGEITPGAHAVQVTAVNVVNQESARSNTINFTVPQPTPAAPSGLSVD